METRTKQRRGFASMDKEKQRAIAAKGGRTAVANGTAHKWNSQTAKEAGSKGGRRSTRSPSLHTERIRQLSTDGVSPAQIAQALGISVSSVYNVRRRIGLARKGERE